jgi:hypothetical protein
MITLRISSEAMGVIEGSAVSSDPVAYDGGSQEARDAAEGLSGATRKKFGRGHTYEVETTPAGAECIADYCEVVGETYAGEADAGTRREGRALLTAARRIREQAARQTSLVDAP